MNMPKISLFHLFILQIESILESHHMTGHIHFWPRQPLHFKRPFNLHEFVPACKKSVNSWDTVNLRVQRPDLRNLLWRNSSFRNYAIWLAESILAYISGTRFFPNIGFVQEHSKFIIEQIQWKLMTKFFFKVKKPIFGPFHHFWGQKKFFKKNQVVMHKFIRVSSTLAKSREI